MTDRWYVFMSAPGRERLAARALIRLGAEALLPGERQWVRAHRRSRGQSHERRVPRTFVSFPGYVFGGFRGWWLDSKGWDKILDLDVIAGVIMHHQAIDETRRVWKREPKELPALWREGGWLDDKINLANEAEAAETPPEYDFKPGDQVIVTHEAFDRHPTKCVSLTGDVAHIAMVFFGTERLVPVPAHLVAKA